MDVDIITRKQFCDRIVCEDKESYDHPSYVKEIEISIADLLGEDDPGDPTLDMTKIATKSKIYSKMLENIHLIPPESKTDPKSILKDYANLWIDQINFLIKDNKIKKFYLRDFMFKTEMFGKLCVVHARIRIGILLDFYRGSVTDQLIDEYFSESEIIANEYARIHSKQS